MSKMQDVQDWLRKYLFWCLCGAIAIFSLAGWWLGVGTITKSLLANLGEIDKNFKLPDTVTSTSVTGGFHPNETVNKELNNKTLDTRKTVLKTWETFFEQHKPVFKWPEMLDKKFQTWIKENPWNTEIPFDQLDEYRNKVVKELERIVTKVANADWPAAANATSGTALGGTRGGPEMANTAGGVTGPGVPGVSEKLLWDPADITAYMTRYQWKARPTTTDVRLAQEDLWVLEQLCRVISQVNGQTPPYLRPIKVVKKIAIEGYAIDGDKGQPYGIDSKRIARDAETKPAAQTPEEAEAAAAGADGSAEGTPGVSARPARLGGTASSGGEGAAPAPDVEAPADGAPVKKPEDELYEWRYIDQKGYPLSKAQLDGANKNDLYRMLPFKIQMHIVQASIPKLLETFKEAPLTMEVTQIRINADSNLANQFAASTTRSSGGESGGGHSGGAGSTTEAGLLPGEVVLEVHGTVYLAQPYDEKKLPPPEGAAEENPST